MNQYSAQSSHETSCPQLISSLISSRMALTAFTFLVIACLTSPYCHSDARTRRGHSIVQIYDHHNDRLPTFVHEGNSFVMGRYGQRYKVRVYNRSNQRVEAVVTVDGRDVINGQSGSYQHRGYVVDPWGYVDIEGFRRSDDEVATFRFTNPADSYAGRVGAGGNVGVIGVALFTEKRRRVRRARPIAKSRESFGASEGLADQLDVERSSPPSPSVDSSASGARSSQPRSRFKRRQKKSELGTRYGESRHSAIEETRFVRRSTRPSQVFSIYYDSESGLRRRGVITPRAPSSPSPFPQESHYAPPPP
jgi:hypothetical protein